MTRYTMPARSPASNATAFIGGCSPTAWHPTSTPLPSMARAVEVDAHGGPRDAVKAIVKATRLNPHLSVRGWPFCLGDLNSANDAEGCAL